MKINTYAVEQYTQHLFCDCGELMVLSGAVMLTNPPKYHYVCSKCGTQHTSEIKYPRDIKQLGDLVGSDEVK